MPRSYGMYELGSVSSWYLDGGILKPKLERLPGRSSRFLSAEIHPLISFLPAFVLPRSIPKCFGLSWNI